MTFQVGNRVQKLKGYPFPGQIVSCSSTAPQVTGLLHIFSLDQIERVAPMSGSRW